MTNPSAALPNVFSHSRRDAGEYCRGLPQGKPQGPITKVPLEEIGRVTRRERCVKSWEKESSLYKVSADSNPCHAEGCAAAYDV